MYVYYKIGTRSFRLRPPTFLRCKGTSKIRIDEKKRDIFFFIAAPMRLFLGSPIPTLLNFRMWFKNGLKAQKLQKQHALKGQKLLAQGIALGIMVISKSPCKGKSFMFCLEF